LQAVLRCHIAALEAIDGVPREILYDRMKTAVIGEDLDRRVIYNRAPRSGPPLRLPAARLPALQGKDERQGRAAVPLDPGGLLSRRLLPQSRISERSAAALADTVANPRVHATTRRAVNEAFAKEGNALKPLPLTRYPAVLRLERRVSHEGIHGVHDLEIG
jgi:transposase